MINVLDKSKCCGCSGCMNICPKSAIIMQEDEYGFKYPMVDKEKCINCGLCEKICPILNSRKEQEKEIGAYACYNKNIDERLNSSSGGIFTLLAKEIIKRNGIVFGAAFDENFIVKHIYVDNYKGIEKLMGSKYVQSDVGESYKKVKEFLEEDKYVLFTGTPCQIEGLKLYLKRDYKKLYTQDIICHGVPSPKVWKKYLKYREDQVNEKIKNISFRNKYKSWMAYRMHMVFDSKTYDVKASKDPYMQSFLNDLDLRDSCYDCVFKKKYRQSDIMLADYWGINNVHPNLNDDKGTSLVVINSDKGKELFELINDKIIFEKTDLNKAIKYNPSMIIPSKKPENRNVFIKKINSKNFDLIASQYIPKQNILKRIINTILK